MKYRFLSDFTCDLSFAFQEYTAQFKTVKFLGLKTSDYFQNEGPDLLY